MTSSRASLNGTMTSNAMEFIRSGRLRGISATPGRGWSTSTKFTYERYRVATRHPARSAANPAEVDDGMRYSSDVGHARGHQENPQHGHEGAQDPRLRALTQSCTCDITARVRAGAASWLASGISANATATTVYIAAALT